MVKILRQLPAFSFFKNKQNNQSVSTSQSYKLHVELMIIIIYIYDLYNILFNILILFLKMRDGHTCPHVEMRRQPSFKL